MGEPALNGEIKVFGGYAGRELSKKICQQLGVPVGDLLIKEFSDGEIYRQYQENIRNQYVFIVQNTGPDPGYNFELQMLIDAARRSSAEKICVIVPYYGYARQERKDRPRVPISARVVADGIEAQQPTRLLFCDLHSDAIPGFFQTPSDHLYGHLVFVEYLQENYPQLVDNLTVIAPDAGAMVLARAYGKRLNNAPIAIIDKRRPEQNKSEVMHVIGQVDGRDCLIVDDLIDTAGTMTSAAAALKQRGARSVSALATHAILSGPATERIDTSELEWVIVSDTIPLNPNAEECSKVEVVSFSSLFAEAIRRIYSGKSLSALFD